MNVDELLARLNKVSKNIGGWSACCPAHNDDSPSLSVSVGEDQKILIHCHAGCATDDICRAIGIEKKDLFQISGSQNHDSRQKNGIPVADADLLNECYSACIDRLQLSESHRDNLLDRGLSESQIDAAGYRTMDNCVLLAVQIKIIAEDRFGSIPGMNPQKGTFYSPNGIVIPIRDQDGRILALKIRQDNRQPRYLYVSSTRVGGAGPGSPVHFPLHTPPQSNIVRITEGELKADIAFALSGVPTISAPGVGQWKKALDAGKLLNPLTIRIAFDAEPDNTVVQKATYECSAAVLEAGINLELESWRQSDGKGIDDVLAAGIETTVKTITSIDQIPKPKPTAETSSEVATVATSKVTYLDVEVGTKVRAGDRDNQGTVLADLGTHCTIRFFNKMTGQQAVKELPKTELFLLDGTPLIENSYPPIEVVGMVDFVKKHPDLRRPIVDRLLRRGETSNIVAATKSGKSWMAADFGMCVATGKPWLKEFDSIQGTVVYIDNELHPETLSHRVQKIAEVREYDLEVLNERFFPICLRGTGHDINSIDANVLAKLDVNVDLIVLDALYRFLPPGTNENDNAHMMGIYNKLDQYAKILDCSFLIVHHSSKGEQGGKNVTDVGSGAGSMSRATDAHIVVRPHEDDGYAVIEAAPRSFPPLKPLTVFFTWPCWYRECKEPVVKSQQSAIAAQVKRNDKLDAQKIENEYRDDSQPFTAGDVTSRMGMNRTKATRILKSSDVFQSAGFREPKQKNYSRQELFVVKKSEIGDVSEELTKVLQSS